MRIDSYIEANLNPPKRNITRRPIGYDELHTGRHQLAPPAAEHHDQNHDRQHRRPRREKVTA